MSQKRIVTIQDISCFGKCSLTVALPIISACGVECVVLPTAVLSAHTAFKDFTFSDLSLEIKKIAAHWKTLDLTFDGIYTGYLGSIEQIDFMKDFISDFKKEETSVLVDPVMADHGKFYSGFDMRFAAKMKELCRYAEIIVPNITEACLLTGTPYKDFFAQDEIVSLCEKCCLLGPSKVVLTGVEANGLIGAAFYDSSDKKAEMYMHKKLPFSSHGTGDVFSSVLTGCLTNGKDLKTAVSIACDFVVMCMEKTACDLAWHDYSVQFEKCLPELLSMLSMTDPIKSNYDHRELSD